MEKSPSSQLKVRLVALISRDSKPQSADLPGSIRSGLSIISSWQITDLTKRGP